MLQNVSELTEQEYNEYTKPASLWILGQQCFLQLPKKKRVLITVYFPRNILFCSKCHLLRLQHGMQNSCVSQLSLLCKEISWVLTSLTNPPVLISLTKYMVK